MPQEEAVWRIMTYVKSTAVAKGTLVELDIEAVLQVPGQLDADADVKRLPDVAEAPSIYMATF